jgi:hypothetical protein
MKTPAAGASAAPIGRFRDDPGVACRPTPPRGTSDSEVRHGYSKKAA